MYGVRIPRRRPHWSERVLFDAGEWELTVREAIFSLAIAGAMTAAGFFVASAIDKSVRDGQLRYRQAAELLSDSEFEHAMRTDVGDAFASGRFETLDPVSYEGIGGKYLDITADYQHYTMHTRVVHYTTGSGKTRQHHTRIEHYWTWDTTKVDRRSAKRVRWCGQEFPKGKFSYSRVGSASRTLSKGSHDRIVFSLRPVEFDASAFSAFAGGTVSDGTELRPGVSTASLRADLVEDHSVGWFWAGWAFLTCLAVFGFVYLDNRWLED